MHAILDSDVVSFTILINGNPLSDMASVRSIHCLSHMDGTTSALVRILANDAPPAVDTGLADSFALDSNIKVEAGYNDLNKPIFEGKVTSQHLVLEHESGAIFEIECTGTIVPHTKNAEPVFKLINGENTFSYQRTWDGNGDSLHAPGQASFTGTTLVMPGNTIAFEGFGAHFDATALVTTVQQDLEAGSWITSVGLGK